MNKTCKRCGTVGQWSRSYGLTCSACQMKRAKAHRLANLEICQLRAVHAGMLQRCYNPNKRGYARYGGRGITVCDRWRASFQDWLQDMGPRPKGYTIERMDNDGNYEPSNYEPSNCKWTLAALQASNQTHHWREKRLAAPALRDLDEMCPHPSDNPYNPLRAKSTTSRRV